MDRKQVTDPNEICVVGLGYVGLPLAVEFWRSGHDVVGFDVDPEKIETLHEGRDPTGDVGDEAIQSCDIEFTADETVIERAEYVLIAVPTPVDDLKNPDLKYVESAGEMVGRNITEGTTVVLESTVYPGATREKLAPALEDASGLTVGEDVFIGYSPERMVPGDEEHGLRDVMKIVSGQNEEVLEDVASLYETIVDAGVHRASDIEVAEAAKCIENIQRDLNIALMNELAVACDKLDLDTQSVLDAAGTKWNFHNYQPGLVGGHCIPVDPFFMIYELERNGFTPQLIEGAREVNEYVPHHIAELVLQGLNECGKVPKESSILVLGLSYKPEVGDVRTSSVNGTISKLESFDAEVVGYDPHAEPNEVRDEFDIDIQQELSVENFDAIVLATPHQSLLEFDYTTATSVMNENPLIVDVDGALDRESLDKCGFEYVRL
ncbi:nucleotide sugar dehydrogenase [Natronoglomus mannanivorans]|uniref:UDP-N-acetyl-D-mannosamine dehydrogenase n=1 Tax=Natronoglomus mannanivorans TaxID=2979990 RepID=A0AAP3E2V6_9EURY|nr:nucleotide sugar dehydrogenase [Halobacteria archaeon AArc-xg1-1]